MTTSTLRNWGRTVAICLPNKLLASLELRASSEVVVTLKGGSIVLSPAHGRFNLAQLEREQRALERSPGGIRADGRCLESHAAGRELL